MVNPPGNPKANFRTAEENPPEAQDWLAGAHRVPGSWWDDYAGWLAERCGDERGKPRRLGSAQHEPLCEAPGTYIHDR